MKGNELSRAGRYSSGELLFRVLGHLDLGRADVLDFNGCGAVDVPVIAIEADLALNFDFILGEHAVFDPEFYGALGPADFRPVATATAAEHELRLGAVFGEFTCVR